MLLCLFLYPFILWAALLIAPCWDGGLLDMIPRLGAAMQSPLKIHWTEQSAPSIFVCTSLYALGLAVYFSSRGRTRDGEEHGSAAWGSARAIKPPCSPRSRARFSPGTSVWGWTAAGIGAASTCWLSAAAAQQKPGAMCYPNILEANANYVITDPKSEAAHLPPAATSKAKAMKFGC